MSGPPKERELWRGGENYDHHLMLLRIAIDGVERASYLVKKRKGEDGEGLIIEALNLLWEVYEEIRKEAQREGERKEMVS